MESPAVGAFADHVVRVVTDEDRIPQNGKVRAAEIAGEGKADFLSSLTQASGDIRRVPVNGRLDQQRYAYMLWSPNPLASYDGSERDALAEVARRFFRWVGPATLRELQWFCGLGVKAAKEIAAPLALVPAEPGSERLLLPEDVDAYHAFEPRGEPQYRLVGSLDSISATRRDVRTLLDLTDVDREVDVDGARRALGTLADLPNHAILDRGRLIGLWEYDVESGTIAWAAFGVEDRALATEVDETEAYVRSQLGDARSYSLDSPKNRAPRIAALRAMR